MRFFKARISLIIFYTGIVSISVLHSRFTQATIVDSVELPAQQQTWSSSQLSTGGMSVQPQTIMFSSKKDITHALWMAKKSLKAGQFKNVISISQQILNKEADNINALAFMAAAHRVLGDDERYQKEAMQLKRLAPESPALYLSIATAYAAINNPQQSEAVYRQGLQVVAEKTELSMGLAVLYQQQGQTEKASRLYKTVLQTRGLADQDFLNASFALCQIDLNNKAYDKVIQRATSITQLYPPFPQSYKFLAMAYNQQGKPEQSVKVYRKLLDVNPAIPAAYQQLALLYANQLKDLNRALGYALQAAQKFPDDARSQDILGWVYYSQQQFPAALKHFSNATRLNASVADYFYHLGLVYQKMGNNSDAQAAFMRSMALLGEGSPTVFRQELKERIQQTH
ncbi:MAG: tetratricopeptide repeat protein [Gammaproteobacteria bacterium]|nr:tetratricopeptide repeat protein [Gammaproteobacteria bacterium]